MKKQSKKLMSLLLVVMLLVSMLPTSTFAEEKVNINSISATVTLPAAGAYPVETGTPGAVHII